ncbi:hypothetical protein MBLNU459_g5769t1 [Dothideomycetes sp. NU459]
MSSNSSTTTVVGISGDKRPKLSSLQTPVSASYPSELRSPLPGTPSFIKKEDGTKTPITPPIAYLDFLKTMSPIGLMSPVTGTSSKFSFSEKTSSERSFEEPRDKLSSAAVPQPPLSRTASVESASSNSAVSSVSTSSSSSSTSTEEIPRTTSSNGDKTKPESPRIVIPPSQFAKPMSAKLPRGIYIPQSPLSPANARSPMSARSLHEPYSASGLSATPWSAGYSPIDTDGKSRKSRVSVRQVVTRTVTYARTSLDPAPKGKRRKIEE